MKMSKLEMETLLNLQKNLQKASRAIEEARQGLHKLRESQEAAGLAMEQAQNLLRQEARAALVVPVTVPMPQPLDPEIDQAMQDGGWKPTPHPADVSLLAEGDMDVLREQIEEGVDQAKKVNAAARLVAKRYDDTQ
tara:strand:+ start:2722 stop:3129 length:408 start_codon:yes stop_codon:yes gene_type:complete